MKKIRFIKENDRFFTGLRVVPPTWTVGEQCDVRELSEKHHVIEFDGGTVFDCEMLVSEGYAELVEEDEYEFSAEWKRQPRKEDEEYEWCGQGTITGGFKKKNRPDNLRELKEKGGTMEVEYRNWSLFIEEKKREFWEAFRLSYETDEAIVYGDQGPLMYTKPKKWQLRLMYLYVLEEYCKENDYTFSYSSDGSVAWKTQRQLKNAKTDMAEVLDKLKELAE